MKLPLLALTCLLLLARPRGGLALPQPASEASALLFPVPVAETNQSTQVLTEEGLRQMLRTTLQANYVGEKGELELWFTRPWRPLSVPNEPLTLKILELPSLGVSPNFIVQFEIRTANTSLGKWQMPAQAKVFREVWVAQSPLTRGQLIAKADLKRERRDVLVLREACWDGTDAEEATNELAVNLLAGAPLYTSSVRPRTLVRRGQLAEALLQDGALLVSLEVEVLEDGASGQTVRVRNPRSRTIFLGKVQNEQTILVVF
jgi:flagellar basal body P-ring formation protein FlgA